MNELLELYMTMGISPAVYSYGEKAIDHLKERFDAIDKIAEHNQAKVVAAMQKNKVSAACFTATTGYGYDDMGRDTLERVYADVFHTEAALVRPQITCGTHALTVALSANLLPGDELLSPVGLPYDTLQEVIGIRPSPCSLAEYGVSYNQVDLLEDGSFDYDGIRNAINEKTKLITIQRSKGYATRPTFSVKQIGELIAFCKNIKPDVLVMVDNCYGEFVETIEPSDVGADMTVGSLIKNPGGGLAPIGGYICGTQKCVDRCAYRLSAPGLGQEVGANLGLMTSLFQGFFMALLLIKDLKGFSDGQYIICFCRSIFCFRSGSGFSRRCIANRSYFCSLNSRCFFGNLFRSRAVINTKHQTICAVGAGELEEHSGSFLCCFRHRRCCFADGTIKGIIFPDKE